jgi:hypothetical protein
MARRPSGVSFACLLVLLCAARVARAQSDASQVIGDALASQINRQARGHAAVVAPRVGQAQNASQVIGDALASQISAMDGAPVASPGRRLLIDAGSCQASSGCTTCQNAILTDVFSAYTANPVGFTTYEVPDSVCKTCMSAGYCPSGESNPTTCTSSGTGNKMVIPANPSTGLANSVTVELCSAAPRVAAALLVLAATLAATLLL